MQEYKLNVSVRRSKVDILQVSLDNCGQPACTYVYLWDNVMNIDLTLPKPVIKDRLIGIITSDNCKALSEELRLFANKKIELRKRRKELYDVYPNNTILRLAVSEMDNIIRHQMPQLISFFDKNSNNGEMLLGIQSLDYPSPTDFSVCMKTVCDKIDLEEEFMGISLTNENKGRGKLFVNIINDFCTDNKVYKYLLKNETERDTTSIYELCCLYLSNKETLFHLKDIFTEDTLNKVVDTIDSVIPSWVYDKLLQFSTNDFKVTFETNKLFKLAFLVSKEDEIIRELIPVAISEYFSTEIISPELLLFPEISDFQENLYFCFQITNNPKVMNERVFEIQEDLYEGLLKYTVSKKVKVNNIPVRPFISTTVYSLQNSKRNTNGLPDRRRPTKEGW